MTITFPLSVENFADRFPMENISMTLNTNQNVTGLASGESIAVNRMPMLWAGSAQSVALPNSEAQELMALLNSLDGSTNAFFLYNFHKKYPRADYGGLILGASTPSITAIGANNKSLSIDGLPADYKLTAGDRFHATYSTSRRFFGEFSETVTANGLGQIASIEVRPHLRPGFLAGVQISLIKPSAKVKLVSNTLQLIAIDSTISTIKFSFQQTLSQD